MLCGVVLRDYQMDAIKALLNAGRGVAKMATNAGKTEVMAALLKAYDSKAVVVVHRKELLYQTADRFRNRLGMEVGMIGDGVCLPSKITVAMVQTLYSKPDLLTLFDNNVVLMVDECFVAGTLVDNVPIEELSVGDIVTAWDRHIGKLVRSKVTKCFVRPAPTRLIRLVVGGKGIICTENHPILTNRGWVAAGDLSVGDCLIMESDDEESGFDVRVQLVQEKFCRDAKKMASVQKRKECLLFEGMRDRLQARCVEQNCGGDKSEICIRTYEEKQPYAQVGSTRKVEQDIETYRTQASGRGREWETHTCATGDVGRTVGLGCGGCRFDENAKRFWLSDQLQDRYSKSGVENSSRGGWAIPLFQEASGREKGLPIKAVRLESVEILERGSDGEFGGLCPGGVVYNIEVERYHTYVANGVVVHNCHHVSSDQMLDVLCKVPGPHRFGFSGTPLKHAKLADMKLIGATGPVVVDVTNADLIDGGYSAVPRVMLHIIESDNGWGDDYHTAYSGMISNVQRNAIIARVASEHKDGLVLVLVTRIEHGELLRTMIPGSVFVHGSCTMEYRQGVLKTMRQEDAMGTVIATQIFDEGVDIPGVDVVVLAGGSKSHVKLLQRIGRGLRRKSGKNEVIIHDFIDDINKHLLSHSESRVRIYGEEGFETVVSR